MARKALVEIRRGTEANLTAGTLLDGEFGYTTDTKKLFIGFGGQNICIGAASSLGDMLKSIYDTDNDGVVDKAEDSNTVGGKSLSQIEGEIPTKTSQLTNDSNFVTETELGNAGYGDMMKSAYDKDNDGVVDKAEDSNTLGGKSPSDFAPSGYGLGTSGHRLGGVDLNSITANGWYDCNNVTNGVSGIGTGYHKLLVVCSGDPNYITQLAFSMTNTDSGSMWIREKRAGTWGSWSRVLTSTKKCTWNDLKGV